MAEPSGSLLVWMIGIFNRWAGHYLIYGGEYLSAVLARAGDCHFRNLLKGEGIPTVFVIDVPISLLRQSDPREFARLLLAQWARNIVDDQRRPPHEDCTFDIPCDVPPRFIVGHYHPARIHDPLHQNELYISPAVSCTGCVPPSGG